MANSSEVVREVKEGNTNTPISRYSRLMLSEIWAGQLTSAVAHRKIAASQTALWAKTEGRQETFPKTEQNLCKHKATSVRELEAGAHGATFPETVSLA